MSGQLHFVANSVKFCALDLSVERDQGPSMIKMLCQTVRTFAYLRLLKMALASVLVVMLEPSKVSAEEMVAATAAHIEVRLLRSGQVEKSITLSRDNLLAEPLKKITTSTPWTKGLQEFEGLPLKRFIQAFSEKALIRLVALNDYTVTFPASEVSTEYPIVAFKKNGKTLSVRNRGPFWIIYPFDKPEYQSEKFFAQSVWQLNAIEVVLE